MDEKPKKITERVADLETSINKMLGILENLVTKLDDSTPKISVGTNPIGIVGTTTHAGPLEGTVITQPISKYPIPMEYREIIDSVLNHSFGINLDPMPDRPSFLLSIVIPEKYSNLPEAEKKMKVIDMRSKVISYADGLNGVRQYAELVANNLGPEIRSQIIIDRANLI